MSSRRLAVEACRYSKRSATVLALLIEKDEVALQAAQWWAQAGSRQEALDKLVIDDRHTVSPQRARNIVHWLNQRKELLTD